VHCGCLKGGDKLSILDLLQECKNPTVAAHVGDEDGESLELAFSKKKVEQRKQWLRDFKPGTFLDHSEEEIRYKDFVHKELILFSRADLLRSIPCMLDGLKPGQRKILYSCFKRNLKSDIKVQRPKQTCLQQFTESKFAG
jgi:hypothetical protein